MKTLKTLLASLLCFLLAAEPALAASFGSPSTQPAFSLSLPSSLGYVSDTYSPRPSTDAAPDMILIQNLHVNRSVQFAISGILKRLKIQGLLPDTLAVEGEDGPMDIQSMQRYPDPAARKRAADYLVLQGEMPGAMHFAVSEGSGRLLGVETDAYYQANLEMFRKSYQGRAALRAELKNIAAVLPRLKKDSAVRQNAETLEKDVIAIRQLIDNQVIPDELPAVLHRVNEALGRLEKVLPKDTSGQLLESLSASVNFYALALLRDEELFKNSLAVRERERQKTTVLITGGFHTQALAELCKRQGLSYAVITPHVQRHTPVDEKLYIARLLDEHLTPDQAAAGLNWAAMQRLEPLYRGASRLFSATIRQARWAVAWGGILVALNVWSPVGLTQGADVGASLPKSDPIIEKTGGPAEAERPETIHLKRAYVFAGSHVRSALVFPAFFQNGSLTDFATLRLTPHSPAHRLDDFVVHFWGFGALPKTTDRSHIVVHARFEDGSWRLTMIGTASRETQNFLEGAEIQSDADGSVSIRILGTNLKHLLRLSPNSTVATIYVESGSRLFLPVPGMRGPVELLVDPKSYDASEVTFQMKQPPSLTKRLGSAPPVSSKPPFWSPLAATFVTFLLVVPIIIFTLSAAPAGLWGMGLAFLPISLTLYRALRRPAASRAAVPEHRAHVLARSYVWASVLLLLTGTSVLSAPAQPRSPPPVVRPAITAQPPALTPPLPSQSAGQSPPTGSAADTISARGEDGYFGHDTVLTEDFLKDRPGDQPGELEVVITPKEDPLTRFEFHMEGQAPLIETVTPDRGLNPEPGAGLLFSTMRIISITDQGKPLRIRALLSTEGITAGRVLRIKTKEDAAVTVRRVPVPAPVDKTQARPSSSSQLFNLKRLGLTALGVFGAPVFAWGSTGDFASANVPWFEVIFVGVLGIVIAVLGVRLFQQEFRDNVSKRTRRVNVVLAVTLGILIGMGTSVPLIELLRHSFFRSFTVPPLSQLPDGTPLQPISDSYELMEDSSDEKTLKRGTLSKDFMITQNPDWVEVAILPENSNPSLEKADIWLRSIDGSDPLALVRISNSPQGWSSMTALWGTTGFVHESLVVEESLNGRKVIRVFVSADFLRMYDFYHVILDPGKISPYDGAVLNPAGAVPSDGSVRFYKVVLPSTPSRDDSALRAQIFRPARAMRPRAGTIVLTALGTGLMSSILLAAGPGEPSASFSGPALFLGGTAAPGILAWMAAWALLAGVLAWGTRRQVLKATWGRVRNGLTRFGVWTSDRAGNFVEWAATTWPWIGDLQTRARMEERIRKMGVHLRSA